MPERLVRAGSLTGRPSSREPKDVWEQAWHLCEHSRQKDHKHTFPGAGGSLARAEGRGSEGSMGEMRPERQQVGPIGPCRPG